MHWFFIALGAPFLWALVNISDNFLVTKFSLREREGSSGGLVIFSGLIGILIALVIYIFTPNVLAVPFWDKILLFLCGILTAVWIILYLFSLEIEETSKVIPWFLSIPIFGYILGYIFLGETLTYQQLLGSLVIFFGLILISFDFGGNKKNLRRKHIMYMLCASIASALSGIIFKYVTVGNNFWVSSFWEYVGLGISSLLIFAFIPHYRTSFLHMHNTGGRTIFFVNVVNEFMSVSGNLLTNFALLLAPVAMVYLVGSFQAGIVLFLTIIGTKFFPHIIKEDTSRKILMKKIGAIGIVTLGSIILFI